MAATETNDGFQFYLRFAKPLVLNLSSAKDRVLAAAWVQKLKDENIGTEKARTDYLKLLLFVLQKGKLFGPFINNPASHGTLEEFPIEIKLRDIAKQWVESEENRKRSRWIEGLGSGDYPPLTTECSADMLEYVAAQDIPNFGVHAYYAISNEPISTWENVEKGIFPKGALSAVRKAESANVSVAASARRIRSKSRARSKSRTMGDMDTSASRDKSSIAQVSFANEFGDKSYPGKPEPPKPLSPLGSPLPPERSTPTWGSNLISVGDPPSPEGMKFAPPKESTPEQEKSKISIPPKTPPTGKPATPSPYQGLATPTPPYQPSPSMDQSIGGQPSPFPSVRRKLDFSDAETTAISPLKLPPIPTIPETLSFPDFSPKTSTPIVGLHLPYMGEADVSDIFAEEPPSFLEDENIMITPPRITRSRLEEAPSLPYQTPPWEMTPPSVRRKLDFSDAGTTAVSPLNLPPIPTIPETLSFPDFSPKTSTPVVGLHLPYMGEADVSDIFAEEPPSFLEDEDIMATPPRITRSRLQEAPSLPYQTPPWDMTPPSLPYQTPPWDMTAPSLPYQTPPIDYSAPSLPYKSPEWDMTAPSIPYRSPEWDMSAPSLPYQTPPYDPMAAARSQYSSLFDSPRRATSTPAPPRRADIVTEDDMADFSLMEQMFDSHETSESTDFSALETWAEGPSEMPPQEIPKKRRSPKADVKDVIMKGVAVTPGAQDIVNEAIKEMSMVSEEQTEELEQLYEEDFAAFPHKHKGVRTPPMFSKSQKIREAGKHMRYRPEEFELTGPVQWAPAEDVLPFSAMPTSPPENLRDKMRTRPFEEVFPGIKMPIDYVPLDEDDEIDLIDEEALVRSPKRRDLIKRLNEVMEEIDKVGDEVPALGGIGATTPRRSPSPVRPDREDDELFFFTEKPPEGFAMSPEDYLSPQSKAALQWERLQQESPSPPPRSASPEQMQTPEFMKEWWVRDRLGLPQQQEEIEEEPPSSPTPTKRKKVQTDVGVTTEIEYETEDAIVDEQVEELYKSLVQPEEPEEKVRPRTPSPPPSQRPITPSPPRTPQRATTPPRPRTPSPSPPPVRSPLPEIPPYFEPSVYFTPPRRRFTREEMPDALEFEEEPSFEEPWLDSPPTPPSPFEYVSPHLSPLSDSPPLKELLGAHEFTEDFFDPNRPHMRRSVMVAGGKRIPIRRHSRAPPLSPIRDEHLEGLFPSPPPGDAFERALEMARQFPPPTPPTPETQPEAPAHVCKKGTDKRVKGKLKGKRKTSKTILKTPARPKTPTAPPKPPSPEPGPSAPPARAAFDKQAHRPLTRKEHFFVQSFSDPEHRELVERVTRLIADVGSPLMESPPPERDEFEHIEGTDEIDAISPKFEYPADEDLPELTPERPPSPLPYFDFESDVQDFMTPPRPMKPPVARSPPREYASPPTPPAYVPVPFHMFSPGTIDDEDLLHTTPPELISPRTPESPDIDPLLFTCEILGAGSPTYYDYMKVGKKIIHRHSAGPDLRRIPEAPETSEFEEHLPFQERVSTAKPLTRRRTVRAGTRRVKGSLVPSLPTLAERVEYPDSPITTRTPASPPRMVSPPRFPRYVDEGERLVDIPARPITPGGPPRERTSRIKRRVTRRRIDFDATPPSPIEQRAVAFPSPEEEFGPPPDDLMGERYPMQYGKKDDYIMDYSPPDLPSPTIKPRVKLPYYDTPPDLRYPFPPKKEFEFKLLPRLKNVLDYESPIDMPPSPDPLSDESGDEMLATAMPSFPPSPPSPPVSPFQLPPSPEKIFGRQMTPEARRKRDVTAARLVTPPRKAKSPDAALLAAHRQYQSLLMDKTPEPSGQSVCPGAAAPTPRRREPTPPKRISPGPRPSKTVVTTSETIISPREKRVTTKRTTTESPATPPMMIPPPHTDPFLEPPDINIFEEEMPELMEPSPEEAMRRGVIKAPLRTTRRPVQLYGYGEKKPLVIQRKQRPPSLGTVTEAADEPADQYEYWPGPHVAQVTKPSPMYSGSRLQPAIYRNVPPVSAKGAVGGRLDHIREYPPPRPVRPRTPPSLSPPQARRSRRERIPRAALTARKRLDFDQPSSPKTYIEHLESLVADVPMPTEIDIPPVPPAAHIEFQPPTWSPVPIRALEKPGMKGIEMEEPPDWDQFESPRTPRISPGLPFVDIDDRLADVSPPLDLAFDLSQSPLGDVSPPFGMDELDEFDETPPCSPVCGGQSPEELQQRLREHEYTIHKGDARKRHLKSKYVHVKGRPYKVQKSRMPGLTPLQEQEEISESPRRRSPGVAEGRLLEVTPPAKDHMREIMDIAQKQYSMLMDSPEEEGPEVVETTTTEEYIMDQPIGVEAQMALPLPVHEAFEFDLPPMSPPPRIPPRYVPPPQQVTSPAMMRAMLPMGTDDYMLDYMESPPLMSTPPRDIFAEAMLMEDEEEEDIEALLTGSPVRRTSPGSIKVALDKSIMPQLLEKTSQFAADHCKLLHTDTEKEILKLLNSVTNTFSQSYTNNPFNELAYCIEKGLDYYPTKESDIPLTIFLFDIKIMKTTPTNVINAVVLESRKVAQVQSFTSSANTKNFTFSSDYANFSYYTVAFFHFLRCDETDEVSLPNTSENSAGSTQSTLSPICSSNPQQQYRTVTSDRLAQMNPRQLTSTPINYPRPFQPLSPTRPMASGEPTDLPAILQNQQSTLSPVCSNLPQRHYRSVTPGGLVPMNAGQLTSTPINYNRRQQLFRSSSPGRTLFNTTPSSSIAENSLDSSFSTLSPIYRDDQQRRHQRLSPEGRNIQVDRRPFTSTPIRYNPPQQQFRSLSPTRTIPSTSPPSSRVQTVLDPSYSTLSPIHPNEQQWRLRRLSSDGLDMQTNPQRLTSTPIRYNSPQQQFQSLSSNRTMPNATLASSVIENIDSLHSTLSPIRINYQQRQTRSLLRDRRDVQRNPQPLTSTPIRYNVPQQLQALYPNRTISPQLQRGHLNVIEMNPLQKTSTPNYPQRPGRANLMETVYQSPRANDFTPSLSSIEISPRAVNNRPYSPLNDLGQRLPLTLPRSPPPPIRQMTYDTLPQYQSSIISAQQSFIQENNPNISRSTGLDSADIPRINELEQPVCACVRAYLNRFTAPNAHPISANLAQPQFNTTRVDNSNQFSTSRQLGNANISDRLPIYPVNNQTFRPRIPNQGNLTFAGFQQKYKTTTPPARHGQTLPPNKLQQNGVSFNYFPSSGNNKMYRSRGSSITDSRESFASSRNPDFQANAPNEEYSFDDFENLDKRKTSTPIKQNRRDDVPNASDLCASICQSKVEPEPISSSEPSESHQTQDIATDASTSSPQRDQKEDITSGEQHSSSEQQDSVHQSDPKEDTNNDSKQTQQEATDKNNTGCYACCTQNSSIPVSQRSRNVSRPLSQSQHHTRSHDSQPNYDNVHRRRFNTSQDASERTSGSEPEYNVVRKRLFTPTRRRESDPACASEPQYNIVHKRLFTPSTEDDVDPGFASEPEYDVVPRHHFTPKNRRDSNPAYASEPQYNIVRQRLFTPSTEDDFDPSSLSEPEYNIVRKRLFTPKNRCDSPSTCTSEPQYNIVRKRLFTPSTENDFDLTSVSEPEYNIVRKRLFTPTTKRDTDQVPVSEPEYNIVRKRLFTESSPGSSLPHRSKSPCSSRQCKNDGSLDEKLLADISHHLDSLPKNSTVKTPGTSEVNYSHQPTHLIISTCGPIYVTTIPKPSSVGEINASDKTKDKDTKSTVDESVLPENPGPTSTSTPKSSKTQLLPTSKENLPSESIKSPSPPSTISKIPSVSSKTLQITNDDLQPQLKKSSSPTTSGSKIPVASSKTLQTPNQTESPHTSNTPSSILKNLKPELPSPEITEKPDMSKSPTELEISTPPILTETNIASYEPITSTTPSTSITKAMPACPALCPVQSQSLSVRKKRSDSKKKPSPTGVCSKMCSQDSQISKRSSLKKIQSKGRGHSQMSTQSNISSVMPQDTCLQTCPKYLVASGSIVPLNEDFVQNITLDDKINNDKDIAYVNTDNEIYQKPSYNDLQLPSSSRSKYFKSSPCLDIASTIQCRNVNCGKQNQSTLDLEDWADELEVIDDPGYRSIQTQYFPSESIEPSTSNASGCYCGSPPRESPTYGSPVSPDFMKRVQEHQYTERFFDPRRPMARKRVRSRENVVKLTRRAPSPPLEHVQEVPEEAILSPGARGLRPPVYPTNIPSTAAKHYTPPYFPEILEPLRIRTPPAKRTSTTPVKSMQRAPPRRRLAFDDEPSPSPERTPEKVTTTETVTYDDPDTGAPITETTVQETVVYTSPRAGSPPATPPRIRSPSQPCTPPYMSPREYDISEAFGGSYSPEILDTSDIPPDVDTEPFGWLDR